MPLVRNQYFWSPLYLFVLVYLFINYPRRTAWVVLIGALITFALSDQLSASVIKPLVGCDPAATRKLWHLLTL